LVIFIGFSPHLRRRHEHIYVITLSDADADYFAAGRFITPPTLRISSLTPPLPEKRSHIAVIFFFFEVYAFSPFSLLVTCARRCVAG